MRIACLVLFTTAFALAQHPNTLTPQEAADGWLLLFDGETLFGWTADAQGAWKTSDGALVGDGEHSNWLRTNAVFSDYQLKCEFRSGPGGLSLGGRKPIRAGKVKPGGWHSYDVSVSDGRFVAKLDGRQVAGGKESKDVVGAIGLEQPGAGSKVEYRNIKLKPLGAKPIFDGKDLNGWHEVKTPNAKVPPVWSVRDGMIHVEHGAGQLETDGQWADFILQIAVRTNPPDAQHHPNSGVFLRGRPNGFWTGYEAQIRNEWKGDDRAQAVDFGTGGIYRYQPARRVVSTDGQFFTMTITARGRHLATWVDGYPVADWTDPNPEGSDVRKKQAAVAAGPISLQAHDPTTNLDFKNIRILELPGK